MNLNYCFAADIPEAFTEAFGVGDHHVDVVHLAVLVHMCSSECIVVLETDVIVNCALQSMENAVEVVTYDVDCPYLYLLLQTTPIGANFSTHTWWCQKGK